MTPQEVVHKLETEIAGAKAMRGQHVCVAKEDYEQVLRCLIDAVSALKVIAAPLPESINATEMETAMTEAAIGTLTTITERLT